MAFDEQLAQRVRGLIGNLPGYEEKRMFGGAGFLLNGNMSCGVSGEDLIVRVGPEGYEWAVTQPHTRPFDMTGRPMSGWVLVAPKAVADDADLAAWVELGTAFARTLATK